MGIRKWLMKQQWRVVQIRGMWSVFYSILILAYAYYAYIPLYANMGVLGPFLFAFTILVFFLLLGYLYDRVFQMWAPATEVGVERNPFQYIPSPTEHIFWFPFFSSMLDMTQALAEKYNIGTEVLEETREYYSNIANLRAERKTDMSKAIEMRKEFLAKHPFVDILDE
jgi:hypothetical protein